MEAQDKKTIDKEDQQIFESSNDSNQTNLPQVATKADVQKIESTGDNMNSLDSALQKQQDKATIKQAQLEARLNKLAE